MAQRKLTSFFKLTPPKPVVKVEIKDEVLFSNNADIDNATATNGKSKVSRKRSRLRSSESETSSPVEQTSPVSGANKKKKLKRQRIESSGSESEQLNKCDATNTKDDSADKNIVIKTEDDLSLKCEENMLKLEEGVKTYGSPARKKKAALVEHNEVAKPPQVKARKTPSKSSNKEESTSVKQSISPVKVKRTDDDSTNNVKNDDEISSNEEKELINDNSKLVQESEYNPAKSKYHPIKDACWPSEAKVPYLALARTLELIEATSGRLKIIDILSNYFRSVIALSPEDLLPSIYMCLNQLAPAYHSLELGIAETYLMKAIGQCTGRTLAQVKAAAARSGDLGRVAQDARAAQRTMGRPRALTVRGVFAALQDVARTTGQASVNKKINKIQSLYVACRHSEAKYLIRSLEGKLRIGLAEQSVLQALALAAATTPPPAPPALLDASQGLSADEFKARVEQCAGAIKRAYCERPQLEALAGALLRHGVAALAEHCRLAPGVPLKPMLAHPTRGVSEIFDRFDNERFTCEWKYDGERAQIHVPGDEAAQLARLERAAVFSRNQENNTSKYPDILGRLPDLLKESVWSCVLDCEAVAYDTETKQILPFQVLSTRRRKGAVEADITVQVCVFVFDLLYLNGRALVRDDLLERRRLLREHFREHPGKWQFATSKDCSSVDEVQQFLEEAVRGSCEGLMVKALSGENARYDIARRSHNWLKLKKDYLDGVGDTIDVVVIGAYNGRGKRAGAFGGFLLACYDPDTEQYQSLCKIGTGFSDEDLQTLTTTLKEHVIDAPRNYYRYEPSHAADVWVEARAVWEVRAADLSLSPAHRAALGRVAHDKGVSLRFPRFIRVRDDKTPEQATSAQQIAAMYLAQDQVKNTKGAKRDELDEYY